MKKLNTKLKLLSMALVGLGGLGLASGALAQSCPSSPDAWTAAGALQGSIDVQSPGLDGTNCLMASSIDAGASNSARAVVFDDSPNSEPSYRAAFVVNLDALASPTFTTRAQVFSAVSDTGKTVAFTVFGNNNQWYLSYKVPDAGSASGFMLGTTPLPAGEVHVEFDLQVGSSGSFALWINSNDEGAPTVPAISVDNSAMVGVDGAYLGLAGPSLAFVTQYAGTAAQFDQFDSRRQTFIGY